MNEFYYDKNKKQIWVVGEDWCWPSRTHIYNSDGEYLDYDDSGDCCSEWCEKLDCNTLEEAVVILQTRKLDRTAV